MSKTTSQPMKQRDSKIARRPSGRKISNEALKEQPLGSRNRRFERNAQQWASRDHKSLRFPRVLSNRTARICLKRILKLDRLRLRGSCGAQDEFLFAATAQ